MAWSGFGHSVGAGAGAMVRCRFLVVVDSGKKEKKKKKTGNVVVRHTLPMFQVSLKGCT